MNQDYLELEYKSSYRRPDNYRTNIDSNEENLQKLKDCGLCWFDEITPTDINGKVIRNYIGIYCLNEHRHKVLNILDPITFPLD